MPILSRINFPIEQLNCELDCVEREISIGIELAIAKLNLCPNNTVLMQVLHFLYETLSLVERSRRQTRTTVENLSILEGRTDLATRELVQDLATEIDGILEAGIAIAKLREILEKYPQSTR